MAASNSSISRESQSREYCLRWNNHQPNLVHFFGTLLTKESFVDVTLVSSEGKKMLCHKMILSSCSPYFQKVFEGNPCKHPIVILKDIDYADLQTIITFIYHGEVNISQDRISSILMTANSLQVKGLAEVPPGDLKKPSTPSSTNRKRDRDVERSDSFPAQTLSQNAPIHTSSNSWSTAEEVDENSSAEIPRKKLKKSISAAASSGISTASVSTNGEQPATSSFESGVGASVSRSGEDSSNSGEGRSEILQRSSSGPPPLQVVTHLPTKSRSLDQIRDREVISLDSELSSGGFSENQNYDEGSGGPHGTGYELDLADVKIEAVSDGEIEFEDDEDEEESYGHPDNYEFNELNQAYPNVPSSSSLFHNPVHQFASSRMRRRVKYPKFPGQDNAIVVNSKYEQAIADLVANPALTFREAAQRYSLNASTFGPKGKRGRQLIRQPRIKRLDNETGGELYIDDSKDIFCRDGTMDEDHNSRHDKSRIDESDEPVNVPIVTVSQSSPTPPSSPVEVSSETAPNANKSLSNIVAPSSNANSSSLLKVPNLVEPTGGNNSSLSPTSSGAHLVKQISQPLLPSHTSVLQSASGSNPVIRRQHSQPNPVQQQTTQAKVFPFASSAFKRATLYQLLPADNNHSSKDDDSVPSSGNAFLFDSSSLVQLVPAGDGASRITISPAYTNVKEEKKDGQVGDEVTLTLREDTGSLDSSSGPDGGHPVHRAGHCPALRPGPALGCNFCWNSVDECGRILRRKTKYHCPECHINLCIVPCFQEYHEKADKKKARSKLGLPKPSSM
ncbi:unnamed protein product [Allacma fusca]|uniref:BTB domain-containing protein n=1 Tax=Allacma fusca TaxID=39272 RepID=A0A8J2KVB6_9HEXA|nr:unnamed protein product [Allacma fusca]